MTIARTIHTFGRLAVVALTVGACSSNNPAPAPDGGAPADPNTVTTTEGPVHGSSTATVRSFKGIPYAAAPTGDLRWKPPAAPLAHTATLDATNFAAHCPQMGGAFGATATTEDCLFLNIFTPVAAGTYPVMFWIHGGAFYLGESDDFDPTALVGQGVIVVTINYRLGALGFLSHPALDAEQGGQSGNYGLMDQQQAMSWVQANIAAFGGDKTNVTIFGESAGGLSVLSQLVSPGAKNLFAKAIIESGSYANGSPRQQNAQTAELGVVQPALATAAGCAAPATCTAAQLRALSVTQVLTAQAPITNWEPTIDGKVLPMAVADALTAGNFTKVPTMQGTNHDEWRLFVAINDLTPATKVTTTNYEMQIAATFGVAANSPLAEGLANAYPLSAYNNDPNIALSTVGTDQIFACPGRVAAGELAVSGTTTFAYEFADPSPPTGGALAQLFAAAGFAAGAYHGSEIQFVFANPPSFTADETALSAMMVKYWTTFAKTGDPNFSGDVTWPKYTAVADQYLQLVPGSGKTAVMTSFKTEHQCQ